MRIGTRASALALAQAALVGRQLGDVEIVPVVTSGDRGEAGEDKSRWVAELEQALLRGEIDLAVHSAKDVPGELAEGLALLGAPPRAAAEDVLCGADGLDSLAVGARVGTSSVRRRAQLLSAREDLKVVSIRGNVDTRLRKLASANAAGPRAIVLARAGLQRLGRESEIGEVLDPERFVPAPGQGILALEGRAEDARVRKAVAAITDVTASASLLAERAVAQALSASCHTPLGAYAMPTSGPAFAKPASGDSQLEGARGRLRMRAWVGLPDGSAWASDELLGDASEAEALGRLLAGRLRLAGAEEMLRRAEEMATVGNA
jgi:hydroxymethylbilane synthase